MEFDVQAITAAAIPVAIQIVIALAIFIIGKWIARAISNLVAKVMTKQSMDEALIGFISSLIYWALFIMVVIAALGKLGINTGSFIAIVGAAGLAVGLALQGSLSNFAAGVLILIFRPFKIGDFVEVAGEAGVVKKIQIFTTELSTGDNKQIIIPNSGVTGGNITNYSTHDTRRVDLTMGIGYADDIDKARNAIMDEINKDDRILKDPAPTVAVVELADSSVNFVIRPWVNSADYWGVYFGLTEAMKKRFDAEGISIPFPQRDIHHYDEKRIAAPS